MIAFLSSLQDWHWLVLALLLLSAEALGAAGFLLGSSVAAGFVALHVWLQPSFSWQAQCVEFALLAIGLSVAYWRFFRKFNDQSDAHNINNRASHLIGTQIVLVHDLTRSNNRLQIDDTVWAVELNKPIPAGSTVEVSAVRGATLSVVVVP